MAKNLIHCCGTWPHCFDWETCTCMMLYLSWDRLHQQAVCLLCSLSCFFFGLLVALCFIDMTDKTRAEMLLLNILVCVLVACLPACGIMWISWAWGMNQLFLPNALPQQGNFLSDYLSFNCLKLINNKIIISSTKDDSYLQTTLSPSVVFVTDQISGGRCFYCWLCFDPPNIIHPWKCWHFANSLKTVWVQ